MNIIVDIGYVMDDRNQRVQVEAMRCLARAVDSAHGRSVFGTLTLTRSSNNQMFEPTRGGTRGGQAEFKWSDVSADKDREVQLHLHRSFLTN